jgi:hypothetical protein
MGKGKFKKDPDNMGDLYSNMLQKKMFLSRALNAVFEHPSFKNMSIPRDEDDETWERFVRDIQDIASAARSGRGTNETVDDIPTMFAGLDLPLMFNPATSEIADLYNDDED